MRNYNSFSHSKESHTVLVYKEHITQRYFILIEKFSQKYRRYGTARELRFWSILQIMQLCLGEQSKVCVRTPLTWCSFPASCRCKRCRCRAAAHTDPGPAAHPPPGSLRSELSAAEPESRVHTQHNTIKCIAFNPNKKIKLNSSKVIISK